MKPLSELKISPAPWRVSDAQNYWIEDANRKMVCDGLTYRGNDESADTEERGNARLIAASPKLYEALYQSLAFSCKGCEHDDDASCDKSCVFAKWRAALAEAAGEEVDDER